MFAHQNTLLSQLFDWFVPFIAKCPGGYTVYGLIALFMSLHASMNFPYEKSESAELLWAGARNFLFTLSNKG